MKTIPKTDEEVINFYNADIIHSIGELFEEGSYKYDLEDFIRVMLETEIVDQVIEHYTLHSQSAGYVLYHFKDIIQDIKPIGDEQKQYPKLYEVIAKDLGDYIACYLTYFEKKGVDFVKEFNIRKLIDLHSDFDSHGLIYVITEGFEKARI